MKDIIRSLGLVFGDIGTSPIYTFTVIFLLVKPTPENILGIVSLILWTLTTLVTIQYAWLAMSLGQKSEGGTIVLKEILIPLLRKGKSVAFFGVLAVIGISLLIGDGVITPAISILSAVEGILLIPGLENTSQDVLILIAATIAIGLFSLQRHGADKVSSAFGPIMVIWFAVLSLSGLIAITYFPRVLLAVNPYYGLDFILNHGIAGFFVLSEVILCSTGGEALFADMGHLGRMPITKAWFFAFIALATNYLGQAAFLATHPNAHNILFEMIFFQNKTLYIPFLLLSILATIIASQAIISSMFSIFYQAITTHLIPILKIEYTSVKIKSQIYINFINWLLLLLVLFIMVIFRKSHNLAAAYGLAVNGDMLITGIFMSTIFFIKNNKLKLWLALLVTGIDFVFLLANLYKLPHGGYWSLIISSLPLAMIITYGAVQKRIGKAMRPLAVSEFLRQYKLAYKKTNLIEGTALFLIGNTSRIPKYVGKTMFMNGIMYEDNVFLSIQITTNPFGVEGIFRENLAEGLRVFEIHAGYMEIFDVEKLLRSHHIHEKAIFYGMEEIVTRNFVFSVFSNIKKLTPSFVQFYKLPPSKIHGVVTVIEL